MATTGYNSVPSDTKITVKDVLQAAKEIWDWDSPCEEYGTHRGCDPQKLKDAVARISMRDMNGFAKYASANYRYWHRDWEDASTAFTKFFDLDNTDKFG